MMTQEAFSCPNKNLNRVIYCDYLKVNSVKPTGLAADSIIVTGKFFSFAGKTIIGVICLVLCFLSLTPSVKAQCEQPPSPPTISASAGPNHKQITISSNVPANASHTTIYQSSNGTNFNYLTTFRPDETPTYIWSGQDTNKTYYFYARATNSCGSATSGTTSATTFDIDPPTISATAGPNHGQIVISSNIPTGADITTIYQSSNGTNIYYLTTFRPGETPTYTWSGRKANETYYFYAVTSSGSRQKQSETTSATTFDIDAPTISATAGPNHQQIVISSNVPTGADHTMVYQSSNGTDFHSLTAFYPNETPTYTWSGRDTNKTYYFYAVAVSGSRRKTSGTTSATTFDIDAPTISAAGGPVEQQITISSNVPTNADYTVIYQSINGIHFYALTSIYPNEPSTYVWTNRSYNKTYYFFAEAKSGSRRKRSGTIMLPLYENQNAGKGFCNIKVGEPVNVTNGNMYLQQTDYNLAGATDNINVSRTYNSIIQQTGLFGLGWTTQYDEKITTMDGNNLRLGLPDGQAVYFGRTNSTAPFLPATADFYGEIVKNTDNTYTLTFKDGRIHRFGATGKLLSTEDRSGNQTNLSYDATSGRLTAITDAFGRSLNVATNANGTVQQISDSIGTVATYEYFSGTTRLKSVTYNDGSKYQFEYAAIGGSYYLTTVKDALDNILETHQYDSSGRAVTSEKHGGVEKYTLDYSQANAAANPFTTVTDALGRVTKYYFDKSRGRNVAVKIEGTCSCGGIGSEITTYEYDSRLNLTKKVDALGRETSYTYDSAGNQLAMTDAPGTEIYTYNSFGQILTKTDRMNGITTNTYDAAGNLLTTKDALNNTTTLTYKPNGLLETVKDARNNTMTLTYDSFGRLTQIKDALNKTTDYAYDARSRLTGMTNALNQTTTFEYNLNNSLKKVIYPDTNYEEYIYDLAGRRTQAKDGRGNTTTFGYDTAYRLVSVTDALNHTTTYQYDLMSNLTAQTDALNQTTNYEYDDFNRLKKVIYPPAVSGATRLEERLEYDAIGNVKKRIDTANRETLYDYDVAQRLIKTTDALNQITQFEYNARSQMTKVKDALNQEYVFIYDALGRQLSQTRAGTIISYQYDAVGNRTKRTDYANRVTDYVYDNLNRLTNINYVNQSSANAIYSYDDLSRLVSAANDAGTVSFTYDNRNRVKTSTDVFAHTIEYGYDANGNRNLLKLDGTTHATYAYDVANRLTTLTDEASQNFTFGYDITNRLISKTLPNSITTTYDYDGISRLTRLKHQSQAVTLTDDNFAYNTANQISQIAELAATRNFAYDNVDRLTNMTSASLPTENYAFDAVGNRTSSHQSSTYSYQSNNKLISTANATYAYDANGNMTSKINAADSWTYAWDYENRMTSATNAANSVSYAYDALGRRVKRTQGTNETKYTYDGLDVVMDDENGVLTKYQNGLGIDDKLKMVASGQAKYFLADHLGSTVSLADSSGNITSSANYDSFGNSANNLSTRYQYTGREYDSFTGLYYYRARWYDANLGRFISEDPIGFAGGDVNLFGYVWNSPQNFTDPMGLDGWGNDFADYLDERIEDARRYVRDEFGDGFLSGLTDGISGPASGFSDLFRVGSGTGQAVYCEDNIYGQTAFFLMDVKRGAGIFTLLAGAYKFDYYRRGGEETFGKNFRIAPFGNRTKPPHPIGRFPHYHRQGPKFTKGKKKGQPMPGQGKGRHRPWENSPFDKSFWDRF